MKQLAIFLILLLSFMGCKKIHLKKREKLKGDKEVLVGTYEWDSAYAIFNYYDKYSNTGFIDTTILYANNTPIPYKIQFVKKGILNFYKNKTLIEQFNISSIISENKTANTYSYTINIYTNKEDNDFVTFKVEDNSYNLLNFPYDNSDDYGYSAGWYVSGIKTDNFYHKIN